MASGSERERDDMLDPAGWDDNEKVSIEFVGGRVCHGYLFNRSHLLAKSLGGTETLANLITATRTQNVGSNNAGGTGMGEMAYTEQLARDYLDAHSDGYVDYVATSIYANANRSAGAFVVACWLAAAIDLRAIARVRGALIDVPAGNRHRSAAWELASVPSMPDRQAVARISSATDQTVLRQERAI